MSWTRVDSDLREPATKPIVHHEEVRCGSIDHESAWCEALPTVPRIGEYDARSIRPSRVNRAVRSHSAGKTYYRTIVAPRQPCVSADAHGLGPGLAAIG